MPIARCATLECISSPHHANSPLQDGEPPPDPTKATIMQTSRLFLRNLPFTCTEDEIREHFQKYGDVTQVSLRLLFVVEGVEERRRSKMIKLNRDIRLACEGADYSGKLIVEKIWSIAVSLLPFELASLVKA